MSMGGTIQSIAPAAPGWVAVRNSPMSEAPVYDQIACWATVTIMLHNGDDAVIVVGMVNGGAELDQLDECGDFVEYIYCRDCFVEGACDKHYIAP